MDRKKRKFLIMKTSEDEILYYSPDTSQRFEISWEQCQRKKLWEAIKVQLDGDKNDSISEN